MADNLVSQEQWDNKYNAIAFSKIPWYHPIYRLIKRYIKEGNGNCIEIGCFPGGFLTLFGDLGYTLYGIDRTPRVEHELPCWLKEKGYRIGRFLKLDFENMGENDKFDIVCSFGFIEHFNNWEEVLQKHLRLVKDDGIVVVTTPNFMGNIQNYLHRHLDQVNYNLHNIDSMDTEKWVTIAGTNSFEILYAGYFGGFAFWTESTNNNLVEKLLIKSLRIFSYTFGVFLPNCKAYSPYCALIARKV